MPLILVGTQRTLGAETVSRLDTIMNSCHNHEMRRKVSTLLEDNLYRRVKVESSRQGKQISDIIGEALESYLNDGSKSGSSLNVVRDSWAVMKLPASRVKKILQEEDALFDS